MSISEQDYQSAFNIMHAVLGSIGGTVERGCVFYALAGSLILNHHFGLKVRPILGSAVYQLDRDKEITMAFGTDENGLPAVDAQHFHAWIVTEEHYIDFMAPVFRETLQYERLSTSLPRKGFVRLKSDDKASPAELLSDGDFFLFPEPDLSEEIFMNNLENPIVTTAANVCCEWFIKGPATPPMSYRLNSGHTINISNFIIDGMW